VTERYPEVLHLRIGPHKYGRTIKSYTWEQIHAIYH